MFTKVYGLIVKEMEKENGPLQMDQQYMMENGKMALKMELGLNFILTEQSLKGISLMVKSKAKEESFILMADVLNKIGLMEIVVVMMNALSFD